MNENQEKEKSYWDEWAEEVKTLAYVFDGANYWLARMRNVRGDGELAVFDLETKLAKEEHFGQYLIGGERYGEVSNV
jgi:hypothetical protein